MSQLMNLLNLSPRVQEGLLLGDLHLSERRMRELAARAEWEGRGGAWISSRGREDVNRFPRLRNSCARGESAINGVAETPVAAGVK